MWGPGNDTCASANHKHVLVCKLAVVFDLVCHI